MLHFSLLTLAALALILGQSSLYALPLSPNPAIIIVTYIGQFYSPIPGLAISFILGYFLDISTGTLMGSNSFSMVSLCYLSYMISKRVVMQNLFAQAVLTFFFFMIHSGIVYLLFKFFNLNVFGYEFLVTSLQNAGATALISPVLISGIKKMERLLRFENARGAGSKDIQV